MINKIEAFFDTAIDTLFGEKGDFEKFWFFRGAVGVLLVWAFWRFVLVGFY